LIALNIILSQAQILTALLLSWGAFLIALKAPIRFDRQFGPTLAQ
jgi:hypothetical protein